MEISAVAYLYRSGPLWVNYSFITPGLIVYVYGIYDAYATAKQMNAEKDPLP
jgi:hypothetical protein